MIAISTIYAGTTIVLEDVKSTGLSNSARVTRVPTLDGGATIIHGGFSHSDRTFRYEVKCSKEQEDALWTLFKEDPTLEIVHNDGVFLGSIESMDFEKGYGSFTFLVSEKL